MMEHIIIWIRIPAYKRDIKFQVKYIRKKVMLTLPKVFCL